MTCIDHGHKGNPQGYWRTRSNGKPIFKHVEIAERKLGPKPAGQEVRHTCDNTRCINEDHLIYGTHSQNMRDRRERANPYILTIEQAREVRRRVLAGEPQKLLANEFGISQPMVSAIKSGKRWAEI